MNKNLITLKLNEKETEVHVYLPMVFEEGRFQDFREALYGVARFDRGLRRNVAPIDRLGALTCRLRDADFDVDLSPEARKQLQKFSAAQMFDLQRVRERIGVIDKDFKDRTGGGLYSFQKVGAEWITLRRCGLLADQMGLGKTVQLIAAVHPNAPVVVVVPAAIKGVWTSHIARWRPYLKTFVLRGKKSFRWAKPGEVLITNYDILPDLHNKDPEKGRVCDGLLDPEDCTGCAVKPGIERGKIKAVKIEGRHIPGCTGKLQPRVCTGCSSFFKDAPEGTIIIFDEAHLLKNIKAGRTKKAMRLVQAALAKGGRSWAASGTPLENHPRDLWNVLLVLGLAEESFGDFDNYVDVFRAVVKFRTGPNGEQIVAGYDWPPLTPEDSERIKPHLQRVMLRRLRDEVLELPDKEHQDVEVDLDRTTYTKCEAFIRRAGGLDRMMKIIEDSRGESLGIQGLSELRQSLAVAKIPAMLEWVESYEEQEEPLVVFSVHRAPIEALKGRPGWGIIMGGETKDAAKLAEDFQNGKLNGIAMTLSGGMGLTLTRAAHMLRVDHDWRPTMDEQVEDRLMRIGQTRKVLIKTLVSNHPLEQRIMELHAKKRGFVRGSVDAAASKIVEGPSLADEQIRTIQEAAAQGRALRRVARDEEEKQAIEALLKSVFQKKSAERLAGQLAEEAETIGLSDAQWNLAKQLATEGMTKDGPHEAL